MILVSEAGWRSASGLVACRTVPELASTTIAAKAGLYALPEFLLRALASSLESATKAPTVTSEKKPQRSPRGAPLHIHDMQDFPRPPIPRVPSQSTHPYSYAFAVRRKGPKAAIFGRKVLP